MRQADTLYLKHHFLIAMPHMADPNFAHTLIYLVEHNDQGAMGIVVNQPSGLNLADVLEQLRPEQTADSGSITTPIYTGGPVQTDRGFVLHPSGHTYQATLELGELALTTSQDVLFAIADGDGPAHAVIALGYAGWGAGQLEAELADNAWLTSPANANVLFHTPSESRAAAAAAILGVELSLLTSQAGHA